MGRRPNYPYFAGALAQNSILHQVLLAKNLDSQIGKRLRLDLEIIVLNTDAFTAMDIMAATRTHAVLGPGDRGMPAELFRTAYRKLVADEANTDHISITDQRRWLMRCDDGVVLFDRFVLEHSSQFGRVQCERQMDRKLLAKWNVHVDAARLFRRFLYGQMGAGSGGQLKLDFSECERLLPDMVQLGHWFGMIPDNANYAHMIAVTIWERLAVQSSPEDVAEIATFLNSTDHRLSSLLVIAGNICQQRAEGLFTRASCTGRDKCSACIRMKRSKIDILSCLVADPKDVNLAMIIEDHVSPSSSEMPLVATTM